MYQTRMSNLYIPTDKQPRRSELVVRSILKLQIDDL
jgi:hypothetical protein